MPSLPPWRHNSCPAIACQEISLSNKPAVEACDDLPSPRPLDESACPSGCPLGAATDAKFVGYGVPTQEQILLYSIEAIMERQFAKLQLSLDAKLNKMQESSGSRPHLAKMERQVSTGPKADAELKSTLQASGFVAHGPGHGDNHAVETAGSGDAVSGLGLLTSSLHTTDSNSHNASCEAKKGLQDAVVSNVQTTKETEQIKEPASPGLPPRASHSSLSLDSDAEKALKEARKNEGRMARIVHHGGFDAAIGIIVCLNILMMVLLLEKNGLEAGHALRLNEHPDGWSKTTGTFAVMEHVFNAIFIVELLLHLAVDGFGYLRSMANLFDAFIVVSTCVDAYLLKMVMNQKGGANMSFARMARLIKMLKLMRAFRAATLFSELRVLAKTLVSSMMALVWSAVLLSFIIMASGILLAQLLSSFVEDESADNERRIWVHRHYGTGSRSMYTMFEATLSGCWPNYARPMMEGVSWWYALFWLAYVLLVVFAVIRVITALFLQKTMEVAKGDEEMMMLQKMKVKQAHLQKIEKFMVAADEDGNGEMDRDELMHFLQHPNFQRLLHGLGLEEHEVVGMFDVLDDGGVGVVSHDDFIAACMRLTGGPRAIDSVLVMHEQNKLKRAIATMSNHFEELIARL